jgi:UDP:flavonoid glycosyltransferase YjiC (YdhE family)
VGVTALPLRRAEAPPFKSGFAYADSADARERYQAYWERLRGPLAEVTAGFNATRATLGLPPLPDGRNITDLIMSPYLHMQSGSDAFDYPFRTPPPQMHFVGPLLPPAEVAAGYRPPAWWGELTAGRPVVHVSQGTIAAVPTSLVIPTLRGLAGDDVVVATSPDVAALGPLPANAYAETYIPHSILMPLVSVLVTNGGYNGVLTALSHGVPLVGGGEHADKPEVCARIAWAEAGIDLATENPAPEQVAQAVRTVLANPLYRENARRIRDAFARHEPGAEAAALIERLISPIGRVHSASWFPPTAAAQLWAHDVDRASHRLHRHHGRGVGPARRAHPRRPAAALQPGRRAEDPCA